MLGVDLYRYKGVIPVKGKAEKFVFQGVHMLFSGEFASEWQDDEPRQGKFIFIGKHLDQEQITQGFLQCKAGALRFKVGDSVNVNLEKGFTPGKVTRLWDDGNAYQVFVPSQKIYVWAPEDTDVFIQKRNK
jgi:hypothetical protein